MLESALEAGFSAAGCDVVLAGPMPTPAVAYLTRALRLTAGVVISASHNPYFDNGIKFFSAEGTKLPDAVEAAIEAQLEQPMGCVSSEALGRARRLTDAGGRYIEFCKSTFPQSLSLAGLKIVVDAAHGAAYQVAPAILRELGATVFTIGCEPDGLNINEGVGATHMETLAQAVLERQADLGVGLDGDADRLQMVDAQGRIYDGDELLTLIVRDRMRQDKVEGVVGTVMTNLAIEQRFAQWGIPFERAQVGDRYVLALLKERGWLYGGEGSGHLLCLDRHSTGDGMVAALQVLAALQRQQQTLSEALEGLQRFPQRLVNVPLQAGVDWASHPGFKAAREAVDGMLAGGKGRAVIRASGTEPKLRLMVEANDAGLVDQCLERLEAGFKH
ncbi:MAG: phosphoglucosamine mutase, partial [Pigmentiphaga sp.]